MLIRWIYSILCGYVAFSSIVLFDMLLWSDDFKRLFAYFGLDPAVKQSGKFEGTKIQMSKRGSAIARRVIHTLTLQSISVSRTGEAKNPVLRDYYLKKCGAKPKLCHV